MATLPTTSMLGANKEINTAQKPHLCSTGRSSSQEASELRAFTAVLAQLKYENMASLVSSIRQGNAIQKTENSSLLNMPLLIDCKILPKPLYGSYHLAYRVSFEDGLEWILKVPVNGHHACFDRLAAEALTSEALTMRMIKQTTTIPIPTVHHFDPSADNDIGCPYILMDFLQGKPLWQGWFDETSSSSRLEQFRARSLQTIAAAMVQLSQFKVDRGGSLRFDSDGTPVDVAGARVPDWLAEQDVMQGLRTAYEGCPYCEKGPIADPVSSFLFMLDRRGVKERDGPYDKGIHEILRLFSEWILEKAGTSDDSGRSFVLTHPDFAFQNFLVEDDGTLCGVIDWDGVAAVPLSVGCFKYPDWLMNDWRPWYNYEAETLVQQENSPEELAVYRNMYAQFVETHSTITNGSSKAGKLNADITRMSLVAGSLDTGAHDLKLTDYTVHIILEKLKALTADCDESDLSDTGSGDCVGASTDNDGDIIDGGTTATRTEDSSLIEDEEEVVEYSCSRGMTEQALNQPRSGEVKLRRNETNIPIASAASLTNIAAPDHNSPASRKARVTRWTLAMGERGCAKLIKALHPKEAVKLEGNRKINAIKSALGLGEKSCKEVSKVFHQEQRASELQSKGQTGALLVQHDPRCSSNTENVAIRLCERTETFLRKVTTRLHRESAPRSDWSKPKQSVISSIQSLLKRLIDLPEKMTQNSIDDGVDGLHMSKDAHRQSLADVVLFDAEHCQRCNPHENEPQAGLNDEIESTTIEAGDVWVSIAAEVEKAGISLDLIKKRRDVIAQCVIQRLGEEVQREKEMEFQSKNEEDTETGSTQLDKSATDAADDKADTSDQSTAIFPAAVKTYLGKELEEAGTTKSDSKKSGRPKSNIVSKDPNADIIERSHIRPPNGECGPAEPESLISRLETAKRHFDLKMALKGQGSGSADLEPKNAGAVIAQFGDDKPRQGAQELTAPGSSRKTNHNLHALLSSLAKSVPAGAHPKSNISQAAEVNKAAREHRGPTKPNCSKQDSAVVGGTESADQKLRAILSNIQDPETVHANLQQDLIKALKGNGGDSKTREHSKTSTFASVPSASSKKIAEQLQTTVQGGRWFETPRGSLKRIVNGHEWHKNLDELDLVSPSQSCSSGDHGVSSKTSMASHEKESCTQVSEPQLIFPKLNQIETINHFRVPDIDQDEGDYDAGGFTGSGTGGVRKELEDGQVDEEASSSIEEAGNRELASGNVGEDEVDSKPRNGEMIDSGNFTMGEICVALGNGNLDEQRMTRIKDGFMALLDDAVGGYRR